jgi:hypothetical protein
MEIYYLYFTMQRTFTSKPKCNVMKIFSISTEGEDSSDSSGRLSVFYSHPITSGGGGEEINWHTSVGNVTLLIYFATSYLLYYALNYITVCAHQGVCRWPPFSREEIELCFLQTSSATRCKRTAYTTTVAVPQYKIEEWLFHGMKVKSPFWT